MSVSEWGKVWILNYSRIIWYENFPHGVVCGVHITNAHIRQCQDNIILWRKQLGPTRTSTGRHIHMPISFWMWYAHTPTLNFVTNTVLTELKFYMTSANIRKLHFSRADYPNLFNWWILRTSTQIFTGRIQISLFFFLYFSQFIKISRLFSKEIKFNLFHGIFYYYPLG